MSGTVVEKAIAPKRKRMLDMIVILGGLKEEATLPLSRVKEEIAQLTTDLSPLTGEILAFPDSYFDEFFNIFEKSNLTTQVKDKGVLAEAVSNLQQAMENWDSKGASSLLQLLKTTLESFTSTDDGKDGTIEVDILTTLQPLSGLVETIEEIIGKFEEASKTEAETARAELDTITDSFFDISSNLESDPDASLDALQKLGTKTRYGVFLRTTAQVKRGKREGRIDDELFKSLLKNNIMLELRRGIIMFILNKMGSKTVNQMGELMKISPELVQGAIVSMLGRGEIEMVGLDGDAPVFAKILGKSPDTTLVVKRIIQQLRGIIKTLDEKDLQPMQDSLTRLENILEKLQFLGGYDEAPLSESMKELQLIVDQATEAVISTSSSDDSDNLRLLISAGLEAFARFRLKITLEKGPNLVSGVNVYGEKLDLEVYKKMMASYLENEIERGTMLILIRELGAMSAKDLAEKTDIPKDRVLQHLLRMKRDELLLIVGETHGYVLYDVPRILSAIEIIVQTVSSLALQMAVAKKDLEEILADFQPDAIGRLANALETFSKARDKLEKIEVDGQIISQGLLAALDEKMKSAVVKVYRTRARLPSTRPKVTIDDLMDVDVPSVLDEYRNMVGYAPILGFGTIEWDESKCLGCKSCEIACPEHAIELKPVIDVPKFFEFSEEDLTTLPVNRSLFYQTVRSLAAVKPTSRIELENDAPGFGTVEVDLWLCVACRTCVRRCPGPESGALELELKWNLPDVVKHIVAES
ncbi:MAG: 4Fe-4S dicluster domain-containing protein [Candidatus Thorarchaeota archaeon]